MALRVIPDLDDELTHALTVAEELLLEIERWEEEYADVPGAVNPPLAGGAALAAVRRLWDVLAPTQGERRRGILWYGPDGRYEHAPLSWVDVDDDDLAVLGAALRELGRPNTSDAIAGALTAISETYSLNEADRELVAMLARLHGLLDLAPTEDTEALRAAADARTDDLALVLTADQEAAYQRTVSRLNSMWALGDPLSRWQY
jgi:hypothetical protein